LIDVTKKGRERISSLKPQGFDPIIDRLSAFDRFWDNGPQVLITAIENNLTKLKENAAIKKTIRIAAPRQTFYDFLANQRISPNGFTRVTRIWPTPPVTYALKTVAAIQKASQENALCDRLGYCFRTVPMNALMTKIAWTLSSVPAETRRHLVHAAFDVDADVFGQLAPSDKGRDSHLIRLRDS